MLKFRDLRDEIVSFLQTNLEDINVEAGKYGEISVIPPGVLVYIEPYPADSVKNACQQPVFRKAKVNFFSVVANEATASDSSVSAVEVLELIEDLLSNLETHLFGSAKNLDRTYTRIEYPDTWISFEGYHNNNAIANLELIFDYCKDF